MTVRAVWFDIGEALIDESREYGTWADWIGVPRHTFSAVFGAVIQQGADYREVFQYFRPGFDLDAERQARLDAGLGEYFNATDLYSDVRPALAELQQLGYQIGLAGNQTTRAGQFIRELNLPVDLIATSSDWGVSKPSTRFFEKLSECSGYQSHEIVYVGDRLDNDIAPATTVGIRTAWIRRGPWGFLLRPGSVAPTGKISVVPDWQISSLVELPTLVSAGSAQGRPTANPRATS